MNSSRAANLVAQQHEVHRRMQANLQNRAPARLEQWDPIRVSGSSIVGTQEDILSQQRSITPYPAVDGPPWPASSPSSSANSRPSSLPAERSPLGQPDHDNTNFRPMTNSHLTLPSLLTEPHFEDPIWGNAGSSFGRLSSASFFGQMADSRASQNDAFNQDFIPTAGTPGSSSAFHQQPRRH